MIPCAEGLPASRAGLHVSQKMFGFLQNGAADSTLPGDVALRGNGQKAAGLTKPDHLELGRGGFPLRLDGAEDFPVRIVLNRVRGGLAEFIGWLTRSEANNCDAPVFQAKILQCRFE